MKRTLIALLFLLTTLLAPVAPAFAQTYPSGCEPTGDSIKLGVPIGGVTELPKGEGAFRCYVLIFYRYIIGIAVILAAIVCTWAGYIYLTSGGDPSKQTHARELIIGALSGLALLLLASTVLRLLGTGSTGGTDTGGLEVPPEQRQFIPRE